MTINGLTVLIAAIGCGLLVAGTWTVIWVLDRDDRRDPFAGAGLTVSAVEGNPWDGFEMPPEIAHEEPWHAPETSPAGEVPSGVPPGEPAPGTAAAAGEEPPVSPPPLPEVTWGALGLPEDTTWAGLQDAARRKLPEESAEALAAGHAILGEYVHDTAWFTLPAIDADIAASAVIVDGA